MTKRSWPAVFEPFRVRNYRYQWPADLAVAWAIEMESLVLGWYILVETGSVLLLTIFGSLLFIGTLLSPLLGVAADRIGTRNLLAIMRLIFLLLAGSLTAAIFLDYLTPEIALGVAFMSGLIRPSDMGMRSALVAAIMPPAHLVSAMSVSRTTMDSARVVGALAGAGMFALIGIGPTYIAITGLHLIGLLLTLGISRTTEAGAIADARPQRPSPWSELSEGVSYIWRTPHLKAAMWLALLVNLTAFPLTLGLLPYVVKEIYGTDQTGLGYLLASFSGGALFGSIMLALSGQRVKPARSMLIYAVAWHLCLLAFTFTTTPQVGIPILILAGLAQSYSMVPMAVMLMRTSAPAFRGRVMGVRMLAIYGLPVGLVLAGALIDQFGFRATMVAYMITGTVVTGVIAVLWRDVLLPANAIANGGNQDKAGGN